jgi:outer membrane protein
MGKVIYFAVLILLVFPAAVFADDILKEGEVLTLDRCIEIALQTHPDIRAAKSLTDVNRLKVDEARSAFFPQIGASGDYSRISSAQGTGPSGVGSVVNTYDTYSGRVNLKQTIYAFGKNTTQVRAQRLNLDASIFDLETVTQQKIYEVKQAYYGLLQAQRNRDTAVESVGQYELRLEQAKGFFEFGIKSKYDVTKAEVDLSNARLDLIRAENTIKTAVSKLNNAMGLTEAPAYTIEDTLSFERHDMTAEEAMSQALENRPDIKSFAAKSRAVESSIELSRKDYYPVATGSAAYSWNGTEFPLEPAWNVGMTVTVPIFNGLRTKKQVEEAKTNLEIAMANEESLRQSVSLEVQQSYFSLTEAEERIPVAELAVQQALENLDIANGRYSEGVGSIIEVADAQTTYRGAKTAYIEALYDYRIAIANLEKAMGIR